MRNAALIVAGGKGLRFGSPKQFSLWEGKPLVWHCIHIFSKHPLIEEIVVVLSDENESEKNKLLKDFPGILFANPGRTRQESVRYGLLVLRRSKPDRVLIHDASRPFLRENVIDRVLEKLSSCSAVIPVVSLRDTVKEIQNDQVKKTIDRDLLRAAQTPQGFDFLLIDELHERFKDENFTDDAALCEHAGYPIHSIQGDIRNIKVTFPGDLPSHNIPDIRVGNGFDVHKIGPGNHVMLFGCNVPSSFGLIGHSDADVGLHSITDALLGILADGDIGVHFSPNEPQWKGVSSDHFLKYALRRIQEQGGIISHIDATLIGENPKLSPHREFMRDNLSDLLEISKSRVSLKATTTEKLGFCGREEGIAVLSTVTVIFP